MGACATIGVTPQQQCEFVGVRKDAVKVADPRGPELAPGAGSTVIAHPVRLEVVGVRGKLSPEQVHGRDHCGGKDQQHEYY